MWTSTLDLSIGHILPTKILGRFWRGAYFSSLAPLQVRNLPRQPLTNGMGNWVRVHNRLAGICGSDLHLVFADGDLSIAPAALPAHSHSYPGHEVVGEVIEIGENVQHLRVGDRVVLQSGPNCLSAGVQNPCNACATGNYNLCSNGKLPGPGQIGGGWSEEMLLHEQQLFRVSDDIEDDQAVLLEPTAVALHAVLRRPPQAGEKVLIVGAGTIGLLTAQVVHALAPQAEMSVMARHMFQAEKAMSMGAAHILDGHNNYESVEKLTGSKLYTGMMGNKMLLGGYDVIYDTVGTSSTIHDSLRWVCAHGTVVLVGVNLHQMKLDLSPIWHQEVNLIGAMGHGMEYWPLGSEQQRSTFAIASDLILHGVLHPEKLITHRYGLDNFRDALRDAADKKESRALKVVFDATLLGVSSAPNALPAAHPLFPFRKTEDDLVSHAEDWQAQLTPAGQNAPSTGPSHFTMAQSEDFTADFDHIQFVSPKVRRPPTPLEFHQSADDAPTAPRPIRPVAATNVRQQTLESVEEVADDSMQTPQGEV